VAFIRHFFNALRVLIVVDAVASWVSTSSDAFPRSLTKPLLDPLYSPLRHLLQPLTGPIDLSPLIALGALYAIEAALGRNQAS